jgi:hypothetical protein
MLGNYRVVLSSIELVSYIYVYFKHYDDSAES